MKIDVAHIAKLANLPLKPDEKGKFEKQLIETLDYVKRLEEINTKNVESTSQITGLENVIREDEITLSLSQDDALRNTKSIHNGFVKVKAIKAILENNSNES